MHDHTISVERRVGMTQKTMERRYPIGAELIGDGRVHFRIWAPKAETLEVAVEGKWRDGHGEKSPATFHALDREEGGYFSGAIQAEAGTLYRFRLNGEGNLYPDPASRFQPEGPHGPSCVVNPASFNWTDQSWKGIRMAGQVIYEMHIGTFTAEGTWRAAMTELAELKRIGITVIEMMPVADFPGEYGWGYDGVDLFAPTRLYGAPDDLRAFIDHAHSLGLAVILDVVYNHFGPDGNYLGIYSADYLHRERGNDWGDSINFDGDNSAPVREFFISNGCYWIDEFHFDGFRFDATQSIQDESDEHVVGAIGRAARKVASERSIILVAENENQEAKLLWPRERRGDDFDGVWNDDLHHSAYVALTGRHEAYYSDFRGRPQEFISALKYGYLFQGQTYWSHQAERGMPTFGAPPEAFVWYLENHDQVSNSAQGQRMRFDSSPGVYRALTGLLLLGPGTPLLFQGEEFGASAPFVFFADIGDDNLKEAIRKGRFEFLQQFPSIRSPEIVETLPVPARRETFERCKLNFAERETMRPFYDLHCDLLRLRHEDSRFQKQIPGGVDGAVVGEKSFVLRYFGEQNDDRLLVVNLGPEQPFIPGPEPLLAAPWNCEWELLWSSDNERYGGPGVKAPFSDDGWILPAESAIALRAIPETKPRRKLKLRKI
ncbi:MAG TPA: malto-oligosyltrehalose trehalohydrolase [Chthoniobacterales bacterium]|nr:malto-oligosyltrehalose trehalohydrolase [Chthoniobacterales bacterium]